MLFPEIDALFGVPAPAEVAREIDTGIHTLMTLSWPPCSARKVDVRFSTLCHDLGRDNAKGVIGHATTGTVRLA